MFQLFKRKKKGTTPVEPPVCDCSSMSGDSCETLCPPPNYPDSKMARLMELIGSAIEDWAAEYHLENLPKKIVFEQALDAMRIMERAMNSRER